MSGLRGERPASAVAVVGLLLFASGTNAENIDPDDNGSQYTYCENVGWLNAEPLGDGGPGVEVDAGELTGYLWAENVGWISLSCLNSGGCDTAVDYGATYDENGVLSGFAWAENVALRQGCRQTQ